MWSMLETEDIAENSWGTGIHQLACSWCYHLHSALCQLLSALYLVGRLNQTLNRLCTREKTCVIFGLTDLVWFDSSSLSHRKHPAYAEVCLSLTWQYWGLSKDWSASRPIYIFYNRFLDRLLKMSAKIGPFAFTDNEQSRRLTRVRFTPTGTFPEHSAASG